jgi:mRNA interferase MazF
MISPSRGEIWLADLNPTRGHEQAGRRPALVVSIDGFNSGPAGLVLVLPITSTQRGILYHVAIAPPEGGLLQKSDILCDAIRSVSKDRLGRRLGAVSPSTMQTVEDRLRILQGL